jgi:hypothetical protein
VVDVNGKENFDKNNGSGKNSNQKQGEKRILTKEVEAGRIQIGKGVGWFVGEHR